MLRIKSFELSDDIFDKILYDFQSSIKIVDSTNPYIGGYKNKQDIYYDGREYMIIREYILNSYCDNIPDCTEWKQCRVRRVENSNSMVTRSVDGQSAWEFMIKLLEHWYTWDEILKVFNTHQAEYDNAYKQFHYTYPTEVGQLIEIHDCYKYDINGAHTDALVEMFPRAKKSIMKMYLNRHINPGYKQLINFFVGMIKHKGYELTYNWIVQRTTKNLFNAMDITGGNMIYANTDGYIINAPDNLLDASKKLGEFKLEYEGTVFIYQDKNYWIIQTGDEIKGSCLKSVRDKIDLRQGKIVHYDRKRVQVAEDEKGQPVFINVAENITEEIRQWQKTELW